MLIEFRVSNFRSFETEQALSLVASSDKAHRESVIEVQGDRLLKSVALYGANGSGKSNLIRALGAMEEIIRNSATRMNQGDQIPRIEPFRLSSKSSAKPSSFTATVLIAGTSYEYAFSATADRIVSENLIVRPPGGRRQHWLERTLDNQTGETAWKLRGPLRSDRKILREKTRDNGLALSRGAELNIKALADLFLWFRNQLYVYDFSEPPFALYQGTAKLLKENQDFRTRLTRLLKDADLGIEGIRVVEEDTPELPEQLREIVKESAIQRVKRMFEDRTLLSLRSKHVIADSDTKVEFDFEDESNGTRRFLALAGFCLSALDLGFTTVIDEIDCSMHPLLTRRLIELFQSSANQSGAQLIFSTHDSSLMDPEIFRRDQIWLIEKKPSGSSDLFSLHDFATGSRPRNTEAFERNYLAGRYGGVPKFGAIFEDLELE